MYHSRWRGTHFEAGYRCGKQIYKAGKAEDFIETIKKKPFEYGRRCGEVYQEYYPEIFDEIAGFAKGLNTEAEMIENFLFSMYLSLDEVYCSCFGISTKNGIFLGRNSDFQKEIKDVTDSCLYRIDGKYSFIGNTTAMIQMEDGINETGLAVGLTFVYPTRKGKGMNAGFLVRYLLENCSTVEECLEFLNKVPIASSQNIIMVDAKGNIGYAELNSEEKYFCIPKGLEKYVFSANHFTSEIMKKYQYTGEDDIYSHVRFDTLQQQKPESIQSLQGIEEILSGQRGFLCQYDKKGELDTLWSSIYDIKNKKVFRCEGNPSRKKFREDTRLKFK